MEPDPEDGPSPQAGGTPRALWTPGHAGTGAQGRTVKNSEFSSRKLSTLVMDTDPALTLHGAGK